MSGLLLSSNGKITRADLHQIPAPEATPTHQPLAHYRIVEALLETLGFRHIQVTREEYAVSPDGMKMFGVLDLEQGVTGVNFSIGVRNANDKSMLLAMTVGYRVTVSDNMAFVGDFNARAPQTLEEPGSISSSWSRSAWTKSSGTSSQ